MMVIIAQLVERRSVEAEVVGAEPTGHPRIWKAFYKIILKV